MSFLKKSLVVMVILVLALINIFNTTTAPKWLILAPVLVPKLMQANISPEFTQFMLRATDSMTNGITPLLTYFVIYIGYLNIYNPNKRKPITIRESLKMLMPYFLVISLVWIVIILLWYLTGIPIGSSISATL